MIGWKEAGTVTYQRNAVMARTMSIEGALQWAFANEKAQLTFDEYGAHEFDRAAVDPIWIMARRAEVGCAIDGGGTSAPADDAQVIAAVVEALPDQVGGRRMALQIAELARARNAPDWGQHDRISVVPFGWDWDEDEGRFMAGTAKAGSLWRWRTSQRKIKEIRGTACPISIEGSPRTIAAKRRNYLAWIGALYELHSRLSYALHRIELSEAFPPLAPWRDGE